METVYTVLGIEKISKNFARLRGSEAPLPSSSFDAPCSDSHSRGVKKESLCSQGERAKTRALAHAARVFFINTRSFRMRIHLIVSSTALLALTYCVSFVITRAVMHLV